MDVSSRLDGLKSSTKNYVRRIKKWLALQVFLHVAYSIVGVSHILSLVAERRFNSFPDKQFKAGFF